MTTKKALKEQERLEAIEIIKKFVKPGDCLYTVLRSVSRSGMYRHIDLYAIHENEHVYLSGWAATALGWTRCKDGAIGVSGCGIDTGFEVVYNLGWALFGHSWECIGEKCPSNDHVNNYKSPRGAGVVHTEGGYALRQQWL